MRPNGAAAAIAAAVLVMLLAAGSAHPRAQPTPPQSVGLLMDRHSAPFLVRVDPRNLRRVGTDRLNLGAGYFGWSLSPDRTMIAFNVTDNAFDGNSDPQVSIRVVDTAALRVAHEIPLGRGLPWTVSWLAPDRMLVIVSHCCRPNSDPADLLVVDPLAQRVLLRKPLPFGEPIYTHRVGSRLLALWSSTSGTQLSVFEPDGTVRTTTLGRMDSGRAGTNDVTPGLAVRPDGQRAFVVGPRIVAEVDVASLAVVYHRISHVSGTWALWSQVLPNGRLAVAGWNGEGAAFGLKLIDTGSWKERTVNRNADSFTVAGNLLLATVSNGSGIKRTRPALTAYNVDGKRQFQLFRRDSVEVGQVSGSRAYVNWYITKQTQIGNEISSVTESSPVRVVDLRTGQIVGKRAWRTLPYLLTDDGTS